MYLDGANRRQALSFAFAEADLCAEVAPQRHGLGVVVAMDVRDEELADVAQLVTHVTERTLEEFARFGQRPAGIDENGVLAIGDGVHVHGLEVIARKRERDAEHTGHLFEGAGPLPRVTIHSCTLGCARSLLRGRAWGSPSWPDDTSALQRVIRAP